jgi:hypothetical protein
MGICPVLASTRQAISVAFIFHLHLYIELNVKTKGGPDGIPPAFFINCFDEL